MRTWIMVQVKTWVIILIALNSLFSNVVLAQNVPGCDPLGRLPVVDYRLTYDPVTNRYTTWYIPTDNTPHRLTSGQFTIVTSNGFTTPAANGRDAPLQITNINGAWADQVFDNEFIASVGAPILPALTGFAVHQVGKGASGDDVDPDGPTGPLDNTAQVTGAYRWYEFWSTESQYSSRCYQYLGITSIISLVSQSPGLLVVRLPIAIVKMMHKVL